MKKRLIGRVLSDKMLKTVVVLIERKFPHPRYKKVITKRKKIKAHNEKFSLKIGDLVEIEECRPISKEKHFQVIRKIN